jgi:hypothetical protein
MPKFVQQLSYRHRSWGQFLCLGLLMMASGCGLDHAENKGTDNVYIRAPGETDDDIVVEEGALLPSARNASWQQWVTSRKRDTETLPPVETETVVIAGTRMVEGVRGTVFQVCGKNRPMEEEVFAETDDAVLLVQTMLPGMEEQSPLPMVTLSPPLSLVRLPVTEGKGQMWNGVVKYSGASIPATAYSRVSGRDIITIGKKQLSGWRVDTVLRTAFNEQMVVVPTTRWFVPNRGIVRQMALFGDRIIEKQRKDAPSH